MVPSIPAFLRSEEAPVARQRGEYREVVNPSRYGSTVIVGRSMKKEFVAQRQFATILWGAGVGVLAIGMLGGWWLASRAMRPVQIISQTAEAMSTENLTQRIDLAETDNELGVLASVLNSAFDRLQAGFEQQARFTADASHELRTPVSVVLASTELALSRERSTSEYRETLTTNLRNARRMKSLVQSLLTLSRIDAGNFATKKRVVDLAKTVRECVDLTRPLADERKIRFEVQTTPTPVLADADQMTQVVTNLIGNAVRYNRDGGSVTLSMQHVNGTAIVQVKDTGCGIPPSDLPHIFDRFYRSTNPVPAQSVADWASRSVKRLSRHTMVTSKWPAAKITARRWNYICREKFSIACTQW